VSWDSKRVASAASTVEIAQVWYPALALIHSVHTDTDWLFVDIGSKEEKFSNRKISKKSDDWLVRANPLLLLIGLLYRGETHYSSLLSLSARSKRLVNASKHFEQMEDKYGLQIFP